MSEVKFVKLTDTEWSYLAGIIDGEGCISTRLIKGRSPAPRIIIGQKDKRLIDWIEHRIPYGNRTDRKPNTKYEFTQWLISNTPVTKQILENVIPYLVMKREQAELAIEACQLSIISHDRRMEIHYKLQELKRL